jgi:5,10-methylenetetrahydrofolate reductase
MGFAKRLNEGKFAVALEITPPQKALPAVLLRRARLLGDAAQAINVIQRPGRQPSLDASLELLSAGMLPVWHLVTRGRHRTEIVAELARAHDGGVRQLLAIRGDHEGADAADTPTLRETIGMAVDCMPGATIGATLNQYAPDRAAVMRNLMPKLKAGASYVQTQPVFDLEVLRPLAEAVREASPETRVVAMAMPLLSVEQASRIEERLGFRLPDAFRRRLEQNGEPGAWESFAATLAALAASKFIAGVAIMTFEMDPPPATGARIVAALAAAGIRT